MSVTQNCHFDCNKGNLMSTQPVMMKPRIINKLHISHLKAILYHFSWGKKNVLLGIKNVITSKYDCYSNSCYKC